MIARAGSGRFQWNKGAWFGSQIGASCWMFAAAGWLSWYGALAAGIAVLSCFLLCNLTGFWLWRRRDRVSPFVGIELLVAIVGIFALTALLAIDVMNASWVVEKLNRGRSMSYWLLLMYPGLMSYFFLIEKTAR